MRKILQNNIWKSNFLLLGANLLGPLSGILLLPLYLQNFTVTEYGILSLMRVVAGFTGIVGTFSLSSAVLTFFFQYKKAALEEYIQQVFSAAFVVAFVYLCLTLLLGPWIFSWLFKSSEISFFPLGFLAILNSLVMALLSIYFIYLKNAKKIEYFVRLSIVGFVISVVGQMLLIAVFKLGIAGALLGSLLGYAIILIGLLVQQKLKITFQLKKQYLKSSFLYSLGIMPFLFANWGIIRADRIVAERYLSLEMVGQYALAFNLAFLLSYMVSAYLDTIRPDFKVELEKLEQQVKNTVIRYFLILQIVLLLASILIFCGSFLLPLISNSPKYAEVSKFLPMALFIVFIRSNIRFFNEFFYLWKKNREIGIISFVNLMLFLMISFLFAQNNVIYSLLTALSISNGIALVLTIIAVLIKLRNEKKTIPLVHN